MVESYGVTLFSFCCDAWLDPFCVGTQTQGKIHVWIPLLVMGMISIGSGIASFFLPETLHENLPQTFEDGDAFGHDMRYFSLAKSKAEVTGGRDVRGEATDLTSVTTFLHSRDKGSTSQ